MADRLKRAAAWLGLVTDDRYPEYDDTEPTEGVSREELLAEVEKNSKRPSVSSPAASSSAGSTKVTALETRRPTAHPAPSATAVATAPVAVEEEAPEVERADLSRIVTV